MEYHQVKKNGFTLVEIVIVLAITLIIASGAIFGTVFVISTFNLNTAAHNITTAVEMAKTNSINKVNGQSNYGIEFTSSSYIIYKGTTYSSSDPVVDSVTLPIGVSLQSINFGGQSYIYFSPITGAPSSSGSLNITTTRGSYTLSVLASGATTLKKN